MCSNRFFIGLFFLLVYASESFSQSPYSLDDKKLPLKNFSGADELDFAPLEIKVDETTTDSITLSWKRPHQLLTGNLKLFTYSLVLTPLTQFNNGAEREYSLPPSITTKRVQGLTAGTRYAVQLTAVYGDPARTPARSELRRLSAPKFTVFLPPELQRDLPLEEDDPPDEPPCNCSDVGMVACMRRSGVVECTCQPGYAGTWCEECAPTNFRAGKECTLCPCTNVTSTAECKMDSSGQVSCVSCLPGHRGSLCTSCAAGYHWAEERCVPLDCLSPRLCAEHSDAPGCRDCNLLNNHIPAIAQRSNSEGSIADGTLPLIGVVATLSVLLLVAAMGTCYRYWDSRRRQPRLPFWSIELQDEHGHYQHLEAGKTAPGTAGQTEGDRLNGAAAPSYNTIVV